jgi:hypothetical protein
VKLDYIVEQHYLGNVFAYPIIIGYQTNAVNNKNFNVCLLHGKLNIFIEK